MVQEKEIKSMTPSESERLKHTYLRWEQEQVLGAKRRDVQQAWEINRPRWVLNNRVALATGCRWALGGWGQVSYSLLLEGVHVCVAPLPPSLHWEKYQIRWPFSLLVSRSRGATSEPDVETTYWKFQGDSLPGSLNTHPLPTCENSATALVPQRTQSMPPEFTFSCR